jgi:hypothetical protein
MRRLVVLMSVVALMMVMLAMSVAPAFAVGPGVERCLIIARHQSEIGQGQLHLPPTCNID